MPPRLVFVPALASTTKIPLGHACSSSVSFKLYVTVYREWWNKFRNDGKRIEVWSDLPGGGRQRGEWGDTPFVEQSKTTPFNSGTSTPAEEDQSFTFSLLSPTEQTFGTRGIPQTFNNDKKVTLIAAFALPQTYCHYSYTFRLTGPGGRVEWLGSFGSNGTVIVGEPGQRCGFEEKEGNWSALGTSARKWDRDPEAVNEPVVIGNFKNVEMAGWAFGRNGANQKVTTTQDTDGANLFVLHPRLDSSIASRPYTDPPSSIVVSSPHHETYISANGSLITTANSVTIQDFYPFGLPSEVQSATSYEWETIDSPLSDDSESFVLVKSNSPEGAGSSLLPASIPAKLAILPTIASDSLPALTAIQLPLAMVYQLQPHGPHSILYAPENDSVEVVDFTSPDLQVKENLSLQVGRDGGELVVVPAFQIGHAVVEDDRENEDIWTVGVLEPAISAISIESGHTKAVEHHHEEEEVIATVPAGDERLDEEDGDVVALGSPAGGETVPLAPESEEEITMAEVRDDSTAEEEPASPAVHPTTEDIVKLNEQLTARPQLWLGALRVVLTWLHVIVGLWAVFLLRLGEDRSRPVEQEPLVEATTSEPEVGPTTDAVEETEPQPETISLDDDEEEVIPAPLPEPVAEKVEDVEEEEEEEEFTYPERPKIVTNASKTIPTPPMTPPSLTTNLSILSPLAGIPTSPTDIDTDTLNLKTKLVFRLPPNASGRFRLVLHHPGTELGDFDRVRVTVDRKEVKARESDDLDSQVVALVRKIADRNWILDVDAGRVLTKGRVEVSIA